MSLFGKENRVTGAQLLEAIRSAAERRDGFLRQAVEEAVNIRRMSAAISGASPAVSDEDIVEILSVVEVPHGKERDVLLDDLRAVARKAADAQTEGA